MLPQGKKTRHTGEFWHSVSTFSLGQRSSSSQRGVEMVGDTTSPVPVLPHAPAHLPPALRCRTHPATAGWVWSMSPGTHHSRGWSACCQHPPSTVCISTACHVLHDLSDAGEKHCHQDRILRISWTQLETITTDIRASMRIREDHAWN